MTNATPNGTPSGDANRKAILAEIHRRAQRQFYPPTIRELGEATGISHVSVLHHLRTLQQMGYVDRDPSIARAVRVTDAGRAALGA